MKPVRHSTWRRVLKAAGPLLALAACEQAVTSNATPDTSISMVVVSGNQQTAVVQTELSAPLVVRVVDGNGSAVRGQVVNWRVLEGGGEVYAGVGVSDNNGYARERWRLGPTVGAQRVEARAIDSSTGAKLTFGTFTATALADSGSAPAPAAPGPLTLATANINADTFSITARWGKSATAARYDWATAGSSGNWSGSGTVTDTVAIYRVPRITGVTSYWMCVYAVNSAGVRSADATCGNYAAPTTGGTTVPVASVSLSPTAPSIQVGGTVQLTATLRDANNNVLTGRTIAWSSSNTAVATVNASGLVTGVVAGSATITASSEGRSATAAVTVTASAPAPVATVTVSPSAPSVQVNGTVQLSATLRDLNNNTLTGRTITWSSGNTTVATVSTAGLVTGRVAGTAIITATSEGRTGTSTVTVTATTPPPTSGTALFRSDWTAGTGNTMSAVQDGGKWDQSWCSHNDVLSVVPGSTLGWTATANVLQVTNRGETRCWQIETTNSVPQGISYYIRFYAMVDTENQTNFHPVAINVGDGTTPTQMAPWSIESPTTSGWKPALRYSASLLPYNDFAWKPDLALQRRVWYRFEYHVELLGSRFRVWPRIYDMAGNLIIDASGFRHLDGGTRTLKAFYDGGGSSPYNNLNALRRFGVGYEGSAGASASNGRWYYAAVEIRSDNWVGPIR